MSDPNTDNGNQDHFEASKAHARAAAAEMREAATEAAREFRERAGGVAGEWQEKARDMQKEIEDGNNDDRIDSCTRSTDSLGFVRELSADPPITRD